MCLSKTASVSAWVLDVDVGKPSVGQGRGLIVNAGTLNVERSKKDRDQHACDVMRTRTRIRKKSQLGNQDKRDQIRLD